MVSAKHALPLSLVCAIVEQESAWNPWAMRYEPAFFNRYILDGYSKNKYDITEAKARSISWGLMQVMGENAREIAFTGNLSSLCDPPIGLDIGCEIFAHKLAVNGAQDKALLAWNGGDNPKYPAEVLARVPTYENA